ncbi:MAG: hypothetical protein WA797_07750 [Acidimicrobiales bacterium]
MQSHVHSDSICTETPVTPERRSSRLRSRLVDQAGEGVISTAIAVLIMALIGLSMWVAFKTVFDDASTKISDNVEQIGS